MKRIITLLIVLVMLVSIGACFIGWDRDGGHDRGEGHERGESHDRDGGHEGHR